MTGKQAYTAMLRDHIGPALRGYGFKGSGTNWTLTAANGDRAIVDAQSSDGSTQARVIFVLNLAVVPLPWWDWRRDYYALSTPRTPKARDGLWTDRLHARLEIHSPSGERWWAISDDDSAGQCAVDIIDQFEHAVPALASLLDRDTMKERFAPVIPDSGWLRARTSAATKD